MKKQAIFIVLLVLAGLATKNGYAHCEIPCGIYNDQLRVKLLYEHITTMEKSMNEITKLSGEDSKNYNQLIRWVSNKEDHANKFQEIVDQYFMHQRIKPVDKDDQEAYERYMKQLKLAHHLSVYAMKAKQTTDLEYISKLRDTLSKFEDAYFDQKEKEHLEEHHKEGGKE